MGGKWGKSGKKRREEALDSPTRRTHAPFRLCRCPQAPQRAGFGLGSPAPVSARAGEKRATGDATRSFFGRRRGKNAWEGPVEDAAGDALRLGTTTARTASTKTRHAFHAYVDAVDVIKKCWIIGFQRKKFNSSQLYLRAYPTLTLKTLHPSGPCGSYMFCHPTYLASVRGPDRRPLYRKMEANSAGRGFAGIHTAGVYAPVRQPRLPKTLFLFMPAQSRRDLLLEPTIKRCVGRQRRARRFPVHTPSLCIQMEPACECMLGARTPHLESRRRSSLNSMLASPARTPHLHPLERVWRAERGSPP